MSCDAVNVLLWVSMGSMFCYGWQWGRRVAVSYIRVNVLLHVVIGHFVAMCYDGVNVLLSVLIREMCCYHYNGIGRGKWFQTGCQMVPILLIRVN